MLEVIPSPGHHPAHVVFYDHRTQILFSGDFLMPGRLLIDDLSSFRQSARRVAEFAREHPIAEQGNPRVERETVCGQQMEAGPCAACDANADPKKNPARCGVICRLLVWRSVFSFLSADEVSDQLAARSRSTLSSYPLACLLLPEAGSPLLAVI
jgi:hypothetical protein